MTCDIYRRQRRGRPCFQARYGRALGGKVYALYLLESSSRVHHCAAGEYLIRRQWSDSQGFETPELERMGRVRIDSGPHTTVDCKDFATLAQRKWFPLPPME